MKTMPLLFLLWPLLGSAQQVAGPATTPQLVVSAAEIAARIAQAEAMVATGQKYRGDPLLVQGPYSAKIEYHVGADKGVGLNEDVAELFVVLDGAGTMVLGGTLSDPQRTGSHLQAASATGGTPYRLAKGDVAMIPVGIAHTISQTDGKLVLLSMHLPMAASAP